MMPVTPAHAELLASYANTVDEPDRLADPGGLVAWMVEHDLLAPAATASQDDLVMARLLRDRLRDAMEGNHDESSGPSPDLDQLARDLPLRVSFTGSHPALTPAAAGVRGALASLLVAVVRATSDGSWERLKVCPADDCREAFHDESKNHSRVWCDMDDCGNRAKTRAYRERKRARRT